MTTTPTPNTLAYLDLQAGISGDMFLGCLVDAGWPVERLRDTLTRLRLPASSWSVDAKNVMKGSLRATLVDVKVAEGAAPTSPTNHANPTPLSFLPVAAPAATTSPILNPAHPGHPHRNLIDIKQIITAADLPQPVKDKAIAVFTRLGHAEAKVHGTSIDQIHFHEVGALDAIVDIVGAVAGVHELGIDKLYASPLPASPGWVNIAHGQVQLPAPATLEILATARAPVSQGPGPGEHVTPTGAALVAELAQFAQPAMRIHKVGLGAGQRNTPWPNIARLWLGEAADANADATLVQLDTNIDDMNPQLYPPVMEQLLAAGALDVWIAPVQMKKGRPGSVLSVLARKGQEIELTTILLRHTTTLGVRAHDVRRHEARREIRPVQTRFGPVRVKLKWVGNDLIGATPEFEDCKQLATTANVPLPDLYEAATTAIREQLGAP